MKTIAFKLTIFVGSIIISLLVLEGVIRYFGMAPVIFDYKIFEPMEFVANPKICYKMKPFGVCEGGHLNAEGFKDREFILEKGKDEIRIVMLGDSITKGSGVLLGKTFSDQLEKLLNQKSKRIGSNLKYEVMNFGVGGYNIVSEIEVLKVYALKYYPDIVVLNYFFNDNEEYSFNYWVFLNKQDVSPIEKNLIYQYYLSSNKFRFKRLFFRSQLFLFCWIRFKNLFNQWKEIKNIEYTTYKEDIVFQKLGELKKLGQQHNFKVLICIHPVLDYDRSRPHPNYDSTRNIAKRSGLPSIDLRLFYQLKSKDPKIYLLNERDKIHINATGHNLVARVLLKQFEKENFINFKGQ